MKEDKIEEKEAERGHEDLRLEILLNNFSGSVEKYVNRKISLEEFETAREISIQKIRVILNK